jgi:hypothetical protein
MSRPGFAPLRRWNHGSFWRSTEVGMAPLELNFWKMRSEPRARRLMGNPIKARSIAGPKAQINASLGHRPRSPSRKEEG